MKEKKCTIEEFEEKYEKNNFITKKIINNFFNCLFKIIPPTNNLLEVGCGTGHSSKIIYEKTHPSKITISDNDELLLKIAQKKIPTATIVLEDAQKLSHKDNQFDLVLCLEVLEHIKNFETVLNELQRVSSKNVIISVPNEPLWRILNFLRGKYLTNFGNTPGHVNHWSEKKMADLLKTKFVIKKIIKPIPWMIFLLEKNETN